MTDPTSIRLSDYEAERWHALHRMTYHEHGLAFSTWIKAIVNQYIDRLESKGVPIESESA